MSTILIILCALMMAGAGAAVVRLALVYLVSRRHKVLIIAGAVIAVVLFEVLFLSAAALPRKVNGLLNDAVRDVVLHLEEVSPGATTEELGIEDIKTLVSAAKDFSSFSDMDDETGFVVRMIYESIVGDRIHSLCENVEAEVALFEQTGTTPTVCNILDYTVHRADDPIRRAAKILETVILVIAFICFVVLGALIWAIRNDFFSSESKIIYGEDISERNSEE
ncbi:MAG: hypothetical protein J6K28_02895 [Alistipes sp.]|nr:hypothetical protein [Alistipes sp.]